MGEDVTRRRLIQAGGAGAAGLTLLGAAGCDNDDQASGQTTFERKPAPPGAMNVVVVVIDSLRADHIYGPGARTPTMNKLAKEGLHFSRAYPEGMPTIPARRAIMAGRRTFPFRGWKPFKDLPPQPGWEPVGSDGKTWTEVLRENGWTTGYVTDNPHMLLGVHKRFRKTFDRVELVDGQSPLRFKPKRKVSKAEVERHLPPSLRGSRAEPRMAAYLAANPRDRDEKDYLAARVFRNGMNWVEWASARQPFALVIDSFDAHEPWDAPRRLRDLYGPPDTPIEPIQPFPTPSAKWESLELSQSIMRRMRQLYSAEISLVDAWLGHFLDRLENLAVLDNTLVVVLSDHGVLLGEYGWVGKRFDEMHEELTRVPFLIRHPAGKAAGRESKYFASTHDVGPTVLSVLGQPIPGHMDGVDLSPLLDRTKPRKARAYRTASYNDHVAASDGRWLLIADNQGRRKRLYAMGNEGVEVSRSYPQVTNRLWGYVKKDAGPQGLPDFK